MRALIPTAKQGNALPITWLIVSRLEEGRRDNSLLILVSGVKQTLRVPLTPTQLNTLPYLPLSLYEMAKQSPESYLMRKTLSLTLISLLERLSVKPSLTEFSSLLIQETYPPSWIPGQAT